MTQDELKEYLEYCPETGVFFWLVSQGNACLGKIAGSIYPNGYLYIEIDGRAYRANRLAWLYHYGWLPGDFIDHRDKDKSNNRIDNLRVANNSENQANRGAPSNNSSGLKGIRYEADRGKWRAQIMYLGQSINLGRFRTKEEAALEYAKYALKFWGEYAEVAAHLECAGVTLEVFLDA